MAQAFGMVLIDSHTKYVHTSASGAVAGTSTAVAKTNEAGPLASLTDAHGRQAAALTTVYPESAALSPLLAANPTVQASFNGGSTVLGYNVLGSQRQAAQPRFTLPRPPIIWMPAASPTPSTCWWASWTPASRGPNLAN